MSIKDLFNKNIKKFDSSPKHVVSASLDVESNEYVVSKQKEKQRFVPPINFGTASNFAKFGSAELYYEYAFKRIYNQYPYDGTLAEKQEFQNDSTHLDRYIFENLYPRTNGFVNFGAGGFNGTKAPASGSFYNDPDTKRYIFIDGGIHTASGGMKKDPFYKTFDKSMVYDLSTKKGSSLAFDEKSGCTIEFWLKKKAFDSSNAEREAVFEIWNQESAGTSYGKINLNIKDNNIIQLNWHSGSSVSGVEEFTVSGSTIADNKWHHYAVSLKRTNNTMRTRLYYDGECQGESTNTNVIGSIRGYSKGLIGTIGALTGDPKTWTGCTIGDGTLSASMDEFRYWKSERTPKQIGLNWFDQIGGGTNKHDHNKDLGVYYKFNEGVVGDSSYDAKILDYSGRITNAEFVGYTTGVRSTDSGIVLSGKVDKEFKDPIMYSIHPEVTKVYNNLILSGSEVDLENTSMVFNLVPSWLQREDENSNNNTKLLFQIIGSYFDTLHSQVKYMNSIKSRDYKDGVRRAPNVFAREALRGTGFVMPDLFIEADIVEEFKNRDFNEMYAGDISKVKNQIYQNIYNNLIHIYKSKGTEKAFRNFFRCIGFDTELIKLNLYADNSTTVLRDNYEFKSVAKPVLNLNKPDNFGGTVYHYSSKGEVTSSYLNSSDVSAEQWTAMTMECEAILPKKLKRTDVGYFETTFLTSSLFGFHRALTSSNGLAWHDSDLSIRVYTIRDSYESDHARFRLSCSVNYENQPQEGFTLDTDTYRYVYDNEKWTLAVRVKHKDYPFTSVTGNEEKYVLEFYGLSTNGNDIIRGPFLLTASMGYGTDWGNSDHGIDALSFAKRMYVGAHRQDFTGSVIERTDAKISQFRFWQSYLSNEDIQQHAFDPTNYGVEHPMESDSVFHLSNIHVPQIETLGIHWDFATVSGSNSNGEFLVADKSSGSATEALKYGLIGSITKTDNSGRGYGFKADSTGVIEKQFIYAAKKRNPENSYSSDGVVIVGDEEENFFRDDDVNDNYYSFEKSPYAVVSDEMINMFSKIKDFSNTIGAPINRYRSEYKELTDLRRIFFNKVTNIPDPEKFFEYFKWIDEAISFGIEQLTPAGTKFSNGVKNVVESHILERNKYVEKFPFISQRQSTEGKIQGVEQLKYNWQFGHAPPHKTKAELEENKNCIWQKKRRQIEGATNTLRKVLYQPHDSKRPDLYDYRTNTSYKGSSFKINQTAKPYDFSGMQSSVIHGGTNYYSNKNRLLVHEEMRPHGPTNDFFGMNIPRNVMVVGVGEGHGLNESDPCGDTVDPNEKEKYNFTAIFGEYAAGAGNGPNQEHLAEYKFKRKGAIAFPMNFINSDVPEGYTKQIANAFKTNVYITNLHSDTVDLSNEVPMQGPFTETWVGGHQSRHVRLNKHDLSLKTENGTSTKNNLDDIYSRPEAWRLLIGEHTASYYGYDGALGIASADYGMDSTSKRYPDTKKIRAVRFREEHAKRPVNIKNRAHSATTGRAGNYNRKYEYISVAAGRKEANLYFRSNSDISNYLPASIRAETNLLGTTNVMTMIGQSPHLSGNIFGAGSNRSPDGEYTKDIVMNLPTERNETVFRTIFSAPGGPETRTRGYLDAYSGEYSAYNAMTYRNLSVRGAGSGEIGTIRVNSHHGKREGLKTLLSRHSGRLGRDSEYGYDILTWFDGSNDYIKIDSNPPPQPTYWDDIIGNSSDSTKLMSFSCWAYKEDDGGNLRIIDFDTGKLSLYATDLNKIVFAALWGAGGEGGTVQMSWATGPNTIEYQKWHHIAVTYDANSTGNDPVVYLDGIPQTIAETGSISGTYRGVTAGGFIGNTASKNEAWYGYLDEVAIWDRILTPGEVVSIEGNGRRRSLNNIGVKGNLQLWMGLGDSTDNRFKRIDSRTKLYDMSGYERHTEDLVTTVEIQNEDVASFHKQHRNTNYRISDNSGHLRPDLFIRNDNAHVRSTMPRSSYQYSWIDKTIGHDYGIRSGKQRIYGWAPYNGILSSSIEINGEKGFVPAITFPTASILFGTLK